MNNFSLLAKNCLSVWKKGTAVKQLFYSSSAIDLGSLTNDIDKYFKAERCINEVKLLGRVGKDPALSENKGNPYIKFSLATKIIYKAQEDDLKEKTTWHTIITYDPNFIKYVETYVKKGQRILVTGRLSYFNPNENPTAKVAFIQLNDIISLGGGES